MAEDDARIVVLTGPESSGKSTLCIELARRLGGGHATEQARAWLEARGGEYRESDLETMARSQREAARLAVHGHALAFLDTDLLNYVLWARIRYGRVAPWIRRHAKRDARDGRVYLLMSPDLPWQADSLREFPRRADRVRLMEGHLRLIERHGAPYAIVRGTGDARVRSALAALRKFGIPADSDGKG